METVELKTPRKGDVQRPPARGWGSLKELIALNQKKNPM